jgi:TetR/AcrR family transcriptional regulator, transcriptional repressor for nem operon
VARSKEFDPEAAVQAAMELFWEQGYARTTPAQLVDALGIGRSSLYNAFRSKRELYERALRRYQERETARALAVLDGSGPVRERLRTVVDLLVESPEFDRRGCLMTNTAVEFERDDAVATVVRRTLDRQEVVIRGLIEEGQRGGEIDRGKDAAALAALFVATMNGIRVLARVDPDPRRQRAAARALLDAI